MFILLMEAMRVGKLIVLKVSEKAIHLTYKFLWIITVILVFFHNRESSIQKIFAIFLLVIMTTVLCFRVLESKKSWKKDLEEDQDKLL